MDTEEKIYAIRRTDGELIHGEWSFAIVDGKRDWSVAEDDAESNGHPATYELVEMTVKVLRTRTLPMCSEDCNRVAEFWGLCEKHAREDDEETVDEMLAARAANA